MGARAPTGGGRLALLAGYALVSFLAFPHPVFGRVLDLGWLLAWLAPALLILGVGGLAPGRAAGLGFLAGLLAHSAVLHWIYVVTVHYGHAPPVVGVLAPIALAAYVAAFSALFTAGAAQLERWRLASPLALAALWTAVDHLRSFALTGFPWATLGYAQHENAALLGLASYTGVYGLSFVTALVGAGLAHAARGGRRPQPAVWAALGLAAAAHALGLAAAPQADAGGPTVRVAALQGNIDQGVKWSPAWVERTLEIYEELSRRAAAEGAQIVVWPETAVPGAIDADPDLRARLAALARETGAGFVLGGVGLDWDEPARRFFDSAFVLGPPGDLSDRYDKAHLVPFGEYVPLRAWLGLFLRSVASGIATGDVSAGPGPRVVRVPAGGGGAPVSAGIPICYELLFPDLVRRFVRDGAEMLFAITNDAWYGRTGAPFQFLAITAVRSAETRVWTVRAANTGVSAVIDARGRVRRQTRIFERDLLVFDVPRRPPPQGGSFYTRHGDVFAGACWIGLAGLAAAWRRSRTRGRER